ncbi:transporter [Salinibacterium sp. ZJ454]|uniref:thiolase C-terminal domain-containing protein n=1 Tax=Salinibacterium sp. ZJ454 TaxID=2708339 RepID=UPI0014208058|nr:transporter [Salinibacterium sp. ZJ454]
MTGAGGVAIVGVGDTEFSSNSGRSAARLAVEAVLAAVADAGLAVEEIDGIMPYQIGPTAEDIIAALGLKDVRFTSSTHMGGASPLGNLRTAALAIAAGVAEVVVVFVARNGRSGPRVEARASQQVPGQTFRSNLEIPHGLSTPAQWYSLMCRRHMHDFGTTREQLGRVAMTMRAHAQLNPRAQMHGRPMTMEDYLTSRPIAEPYLLLDCCLETDGASAVVLTSAERAAHLLQPAVHILSVAEGHADSADDLAARPIIYDGGLSKAAPRAFASAGLRPSDVDLALIYDCFTFEVIQQLEEAGFVERGQGGPFVEDGHIAIGGTLPVNPHGGLLSEGHIAGMNHIVEGVRQLRGQATGRQIHGANIAAVTGWGDLGDGALALLGSARAVAR